MKKVINYPTEIILKSVFRNEKDQSGTIEKILADFQIEGNISTKQSRNGKFISYTVKGIFPSDEVLNTVCARITALRGYMMMF